MAGIRSLPQEHDQLSLRHHEASTCLLLTGPSSHLDALSKKRHEQFCLVAVADDACFRNTLPGRQALLEEVPKARNPCRSLRPGHEMTGVTLVCRHTIRYTPNLMSKSSGTHTDTANAVMCPGLRTHRPSGCMSQHALGTFAWASCIEQLSTT